MQVILLERIESLGQLGEVVKVKDGFARNYLLPRKKALRANKENLAYFETKRADIEAANQKRREAALGISGKLDGYKLILVRQAGEGGQLYGSVTARDIADGLIAAGFKIERGQVVLNSPIKALGMYPVPVRLHADVRVGIEVTVARSTEQADLDAARNQAAALLERAEDADRLAGGEAEGDDAQPAEAEKAAE
ncbi:MAG: 50S ribosomal protein L9 [Rhodospirillaceae bacterium]|nr:50S ribosomal protein L9 [Rhodospirillaceae bacterium]